MLHISDFAHAKQNVLPEAPLAKVQNKRKIFAIAAMAFLLLVAASLAVIVFWGGTTPQSEQTAINYLSAHYTKTKIALISSSASFTPTNQTYTSDDGKIVLQGGGLYVINITLRNDYSKQNLPPTGSNPTALQDGTAYVCLKANLVVYDVVYPSINLTPSEFATNPDLTGIVLPCGQTKNYQIILATDHKDISGYFFALIFQ